MTMVIPVAVNMKENRRPSFSIVYQVPNDATRNHTWRIPDSSSEVWYDRPTEFSNCKRSQSGAAIGWRSGHTM